MVDEKAFGKLIERAIIDVFSKHINDPENNPLNTAIFSAPEFQGIYSTMVKVASASKDATWAVNELMGVIKKQQVQIASLASAVNMLVRRSEEESAVMDPRTLTVVKKTEKPN